MGFTLCPYFAWGFGGNHDGREELDCAVWSGACVGYALLYVGMCTLEDLAGGTEDG